VSYFVYKLVSPRPSFPSDMTESEGAAMRRHFGYWQELIGAGSVLIYGPVGDPAGTWGLAVVEADTQAEVSAIGDSDPAVTSGVCRYEVYPMLNATVRPSSAGASGIGPLNPRP
jgi:uncharacterized protein YciI